MIELNHEIKKMNGQRKFLVGDSRGFLWQIIIDKQRGTGSINCVTGIKNNVDEVVELDGSEFGLNPVSSLHKDMRFLTTVIESRYKAA